MQESLIATGIRYTSGLQKEEQDALAKQHELKRRKQKLSLQNQVSKAKDDFIKLLLLIKAYYSEADWKSVEEVETEYNKLSSETAKFEAVKEQIRIRVDGFGWK